MDEEKKDIIPENDDTSEIKKVIMRILTDEDFKRKLIDDPDKALEEYDLTETQRILIKSLGPEDFERITPENVHEFFSADAAVYTPDEGAELDEFDVFDGDDDEDILE